MDALFRKFGIYAHQGQSYEPADSDVVLYYREAKDGQLLEEGITEAGSMASFTAAGTAYATHGVNTSRSSSSTRCSASSASAT
jgi:pyruvate dehydrogenase E1 component